MELKFNSVSEFKSMKMSFSCTSLQRSSENLESTELARIRTNRPYNSLTKKRKDPNQEYHQRTWINRDDCKDDFWAAIRSNYDYIMDTNLIDSCKEADGELIWDEGDVSTLSWGLKEVSCQFSELYSWLGILQEMVYSKEENLLDKSLRAAHMEELRRKAYRRRLFNEQAAKLVARTPSLRDEVAWRVDHLNAKWELVEQIMAPAQPASEHQDVFTDFEHEVKCLRKWLREMESRLQPLSFNVDWTFSELEEKATEHMVLQKDIETHGRIVNSIVKLGERVFKQQQYNFKNHTDNGEIVENQQSRQFQAVRVAQSLERRWHLLFLRALEWQCHIETLATRICNRNVISYRCSSDSDEEPVTKQPRLSRRQFREPRKKTYGDSERPSLKRRGVSGHLNRKVGVIPSCFSDSDMSSGTQNNDEESYFEDDIEQLCVTESKHKISRSSESIEVPLPGDQGTDGDIEEGEASDDDMAPTLDPTMTTVDEVDGPSLEKLLKDSSKRRKIVDESSSFNTSDRKSKNCATFYFKHRDTDSEVDRVYDNDFDQNESSEEEWTYMASPTVTSENGSNKNKTNVVVRLDFGEAAIEDIECLEGKEHDQAITENGKIDNCDSEDETKKDIRKLILEVEKLVSEEGQKGISKNLPSLIFDNYGQNNYRAKYARIKEWLKLNSHHHTEEIPSLQNWQPLDSCDASGEYTTGESDVEKQSNSSDDIQSSVVTYRQYEGIDCVMHSVSQETFNDTDQTSANEVSNPIGPQDASTPKVMMRSKTKSNGPRPWSVSCVFDQLNSTNDSTISQFSISETALHQLVASPPIKSVSLDASESRVPFNNSTSTLLEESGRSIRNSFLRKKKSKLRKKNLSRKSESGSDGLNGNSGGSDASGTHNNRPVQKIQDHRMRFKKPDCHRCLVSLVTHGSTISCHLHNDGIDKSFVGYPSPSIKLTCCTPDPSSGNTEDIFLANHDTSLDILINRKEVISPINGDSDVEKNSLGNHSFSEQAWDSYQEKYMSEPYSEAADVETARKLLDFGDDYRNYLDSQSDCASSLSAVRSYSPPLITNRIYSKISINSSNDSDSDSDDCRCVVEKSYRKLLVMENHFTRNNANVKTIKDHMEFENVCRDNIKYLQSLVEANCSMSEKSMKQISGLAERWKNLSHKAEEAQRTSSLQREMAAMHLELRSIHERLICHEIVLEPAYMIEDNINQITTELATLREHKNVMLALNVSAHRLITELGATATSVSVSLKDAIADLYRIWDETFQRGNQKLCALQAIQQFGTRLAELQNALRRDKDTLAVLDAALQAGAITEVASSVRDVARLLSEKQNTNCQNKVIKEDVLTLVSSENFVESGLMSLGQEGGSFSDSGISDSGSEQELNERERRLAALRRLTRSLESQLAPGNEALTELWRRVEDAEVELRSLQKQCRELIVRTAVSVKAKVSTRSQAKHLSSKRKKRFVDSETSRKSNKMTGTDDPDEESNKSESWVWRILKAALPLQLALVALFCAACLLEPHCCEASNNVNFLFTPQLRYVRGPPPI
ncbi:klarsicht protein [Microplitis mediator]|uniref:klarsicht protein n=1 Tax=Microplitis mediator TaxID=375433 RepID=UPI00255311C5|nr:klarsicht protein [Microplitis mediator]XP_057318063.1 klarsicht protein [Microplitis mediator]